MQKDNDNLVARYKARLESLNTKTLDEGISPQEGLEIKALTDAIEYRSETSRSTAAFALGSQKQDLFSDYLHDGPKPAKEMCLALANRQNTWTFRDLWQGLNNSIRKKALVVISGEGGKKIVALPGREGSGLGRHRRGKLPRKSKD